MDTSATISIQVNGDLLETPSGTHLSDLLASLDLAPQSVLVEHNGVALFRTDWPQVTLSDGDQLEVIRVVAGG